ncbi:unnamed protein product, partial [Adineta ricciae]
MAITFVTGNKNKLVEVQAILVDVLPNLRSEALDLPEYQGEPEYISKEKAKIAAERVQGPVLVEDTSLCFNALHGLPGPYIKWFLDKLGHDGLNKLLAAYEDKTAYAQCVFSFCAGPSSEPIAFVGRCPGRIVPARGPNNFGWTSIFQPDDEHGQPDKETFAEMDKTKKNKISHRICISSSTQCGCSLVKPILNEAKIVGGFAARNNSWPWIVSIRRSKSDSSSSGPGSVLCGGSLINEKYVLTAAHCFSNMKDSQLSNYFAVIGAIYSNDTNPVRVGFKSMILHENYNGNTYENDIALLELNYSVSFSDSRIGFICLPPNNQVTYPYSGMNATAIGWGR